ncbi:MAG: imidazole glycerol phosphate synthase subunit HisH [Bacteroidales bacterium]|jgi:glutamine amidotransferase|nr:imidazole glycerol phosphate synthase subunit HisH [Bacteroidales bacterium]MDD3166369.1 imidazole glycerol phosphate synthase subunit HisH [Bacteroidales bacterium]MDD4770866.1 imidazole glycerol phosphate synthase subunit HisH [Bacteroidales bacterium]HKL91867.1 imidazole glycerol phosphate synthase subunit HisH [Bacteroidales bacterium]
MSIAVIKYNAGNIHSVVHGLRRIGVEPIVTDDFRVLRAADKVIFPGVGEASSTMAYLRAHQLDQLIRSLTQPVLGICIGLQLMCRHSEEGDVDCLGIFDADVKRFVSERIQDKVPHMGWNTLQQTQTDLLKDMEAAYVYYVHSYYASLSSQTIAVTDYLNPFSAALHRDNFYATQFHPEKSGMAGAQVLKNFLLL